MKNARRTRGARIAMLVAAWLAVSAAFGLHPEPAAASADPSPAVGRAASAGESLLPHDCLACRAHRPLVFAPTPSQPAAPQRTAVRRFARRSAPLLSAAPSPCDGRAPPEPA